ncbi:BtaA family protein [Parapedobacter tibetensis]|uniref:BtaA family protein n=1 Tax=Parapedobacter tibetensis TaxID=2972951 RepID=UPI00214DD570|nr:BtaA family protein [Parapedobacter tibetensis]
MTSISNRADFSVLRYANCWEDADVLLSGLGSREGSRILSIASAGDNSFSLLSTNPEQVIAVDLSGTQLALLELKRIAMQQLSYGEVLLFFGFRPCNERLQTLERLKSYLPEDVFNYWKTKPDLIRKGVVTQGKFERYFQLFNQYVLPWIHSKRTVRKLLSPKPAAIQTDFYHHKWNTWRWRLFFKLFFSKAVMGRFGRDPAFLQEVEVQVGSTIFNRAERHLTTVAAQHNFMLHYNLIGNFGNFLPHYLLPENYIRIIPNLHRLQVFEGYAEDALDKFGRVDYMNLSNIFEYMDTDTFRQVADRLVDGLNPKGKMAYWNLMVPRRVSSVFPDKLTYLSELSTRLTESDKGFFYERFIVEEAHG